MSEQPPEPDAQDKKLFAIAYSQARRLGLRREDAQDCAMEFLLHILPTLADAAPVDASGSFHAGWINRCAHNHACNYLRALTRRQQREISWTERFGSQLEQLWQAHPSAAAGPKTLTLRREFWTQVAVALQQLTPAQQDLFIRYHLRNQSVRDLATRTGRTPHAIEESLSNIRKHLAALLTSRGWTDAEAHSLFRTSNVNPAGGLPGR